MASAEVTDDPLGARPKTVEASDIPKWSESQPPHYDVLNNDRTPPFIFNSDINAKVALWCGDITRLCIEAIVNSTNESMSDKSPLSEAVFQEAGPQLRIEIKRDVKNCKTGETKLTKAYQLPSRYIIHTVGPRYNAKYQTAAENALYNCYRNILQTARERQITAVGVCCIHSTRRHYPVDDGCHIALRTVRRFLEHFPTDFDSVVFVLNDSEYSVYGRLMPLYFPRSDDEAMFAAAHLPDNLGNEFGEPVIPERQIRICNNPAVMRPIFDRYDNNDNDSDDGERALDIHEQFELSMAVGQHDFAKMESNHDASRRSKIRGRTSIESERLFNLRRYGALLKRARSVDLTEIASLRCLYQSGYDKMGRPVLVFVGKHFAFDNIDLEKGILYLIHVMDSLVAQKFTVIYIHTETTKANVPAVAYLKEIYRIVDDRYRDNLHAFYMLHPTVWTRLTTWWFTTFTASHIKNKVKVVHGVEYLYSVINPDQLDIPPFVLDYDLKVNGARYYIPDDNAGGL